MPPALSASPTDRWFPTRQPLAQASVRLLCLPFAGGAASAFLGWNKSLPPGVELCAAQPPGRERRLSEPAFRELESLLDSLEAAAAPLLDKPFVLFGYSLGGRIAFELTRRLQK